MEKYELTLFDERIVDSNKKKKPDPLLKGNTRIQTCLNHQAKDKFFQY